MDPTYWSRLAGLTAIAAAIGSIRPSQGRAHACYLQSRRGNDGTPRGKQKAKMVARRRKREKARKQQRKRR